MISGISVEEKCGDYYLASDVDALREKARERIRAVLQEDLPWDMATDRILSAIFDEVTP